MTEDDPFLPFALPNNRRSTLDLKHVSVEIFTLLFGEYSRIFTLSPPVPDPNRPVMTYVESGCLTLDKSHPTFKNPPDLA